MAISHDADSSSAAQTTSTSYSWNHTCTGSNLVLVVGFALRPFGANVTSLTYNGVSLTKIRGENDAAFNRVTELWYLKNPSTGTNSISVTLSGSPSHSTGHATSLAGVQGLDANNGAKQTGADTHPVVNVTTVAGNSWIVDILCTDIDDGVATPDSPQVLSSKTIAAGAHTGAMSYKGPVVTPGSTSEGYTVTNGQWAISAASFSPFAAIAKGFMTTNTRFWGG